MQHYQAITKAATLMARSNGAINRHRTEADFLDKLALVMMHSPHDLDAIDKFLASRTDDQLLTIVDGERTEMEAELIGAPVATDMLLNDVFENAL